MCPWYATLNNCCKALHALTLEAHNVASLLQIDFPKISAIEVNAAGELVPTIPPTVPTRAPVNSPPGGFQPILINCGGLDYVAADGKIWTADHAYAGGQVFATNAPIAGTVDKEVFRTTRWGQVKYEVPVPSGKEP
jgi:Malectin domain